MFADKNNQIIKIHDDEPKRRPKPKVNDDGDDLEQQIYKATEEA